jgi:chromosome segregation ATPase
MTSTSTAQTIFARLVREHTDLTDIDRRIMRAFEELMEGRPQTTDGSLTVVNIAAEAGVGRASYYRSPVAAAIKEILAAPEARRPEVDELKAEITRLRKAERDLRKEKAAELRELQDTVATYANQIQALTLRNAELEEDARKLRSQVDEATRGAVRPLR